MCKSEVNTNNVPIKLWAPVEEVEAKAIQQLKNTAELPWVFKHVSAMADCHLGVGATVGSVVAMKNAVAPAAVGVDIGCGMGAIKTNLRAEHLPDSLRALRLDIEASVPVGFNQHDSERSAFSVLFKDLFNRYDQLSGYVQNDHVKSKARKQLGTLGGGNHFIEICLDTEGQVWIMLHSGSRNIGKVLAEIHISKARELAHNTALPDRDLAVFLAGTTEMAEYRRDLMWAQEYAYMNRVAMFEILKSRMAVHFPNIQFEKPILCHHNYVSEETHFGEEVIVTRKGAISAKKGQLGIIPGSMGTKSYIVSGLGNPDSFHSASHGAGRRMSRGAAKRNFTMDDFNAQTNGVECRKDTGVLDEIPGAYKDIDVVMANQEDLVTVVAELKQVLCVKG